MSKQQAFSATAIAELQQEVAELREALRHLTDAVITLAQKQGVDLGGIAKKGEEQ